MIGGERQRILLTGSSGLIGTNLALRLLAEGYEVVGLDIRPNPWTDLFPTLLCDLAMPGVGEHIGPFLPESIDLVVHFAAFAKVHLSVRSPESSLQNVQMLHTVLELCREREIPLLYSSSREVYGDRSEERISESMVDLSRPASPYAAGKMAAEAYIYSYARCFGLRALVYRFSNVFGPYDNELHRMERVVPLFIEKISQRERITIYGGEKVLDFTYVDDCVEGVFRGLEWLLDGGAGGTLNLATGRGVSLVDLARVIGTAVGEKPLIAIGPTQTGEITRYVADITAINELLGYRPETSLAEGIQKTVAWWMRRERVGSYRVSNQYS